MRNKREKFIELAEARVNRAIKDIRLIGNLSNKGTYEYFEDDTREMFKALQKELDAAKSRFSSKGQGSNESFRFDKTQKQ